MMIDACPNEVLHLVLSNLGVRDLFSCMDVSPRWQSAAEHVLSRGETAEQVSEAVGCLIELIRRPSQGRHEEEFAKANILLKMDGLNIERQQSLMGLLMLAIIHRRTNIAHLILDRPDLSLEVLNSVDKRITEYFGCEHVYRRMVTKRTLHRDRVRVQGGDFPIHTVLSEGDGDLEAIRTLVEVEHYSPNQRNGEGVSPLYIAANEGNLEACKLLIGLFGVNPNEPSQSGQDFTPLHAAVINGRLPVIDYLVSLPQVNVNRMDNEGKHPLGRNTTLAEHRELIWIRWFDEPYKSPRGLTPLHYAVLMGFMEAITLLVNHPRIKMDSGTTEGITPLHLAVSDPNVLKMMLDAHPTADVNCRDREGLTPLHWAVLKESVGSVRLLASHLKLDVDFKDNKGIHSF